jgi:hypothetical protein
LNPSLLTLTPTRFGGCGSVLSIHSDELSDPPLPATGGLREEEAVAMLRLFYAQENHNAPEPQKRTKKQLELAQAAGPVVGRGVLGGGGSLLE